MLVNRMQLTSTLQLDSSGTSNCSKFRTDHIKFNLHNYKQERVHNKLQFTNLHKGSLMDSLFGWLNKKQLIDTPKSPNWTDGRTKRPIETPSRSFKNIKWTYIRRVFASVRSCKIFVGLSSLLLFRGNNKIPSYFVGFAQNTIPY